MQFGVAADERFRPRRCSGCASRILVSTNITGNWLPRFERFGKSLYN
jgi:hypothetical protein